MWFLRSICLLPTELFIFMAGGRAYFFDFLVQLFGECLCTKIYRKPYCKVDQYEYKAKREQYDGLEGDP